MGSPKLNTKSFGHAFVQGVLFHGATHVHSPVFFLVMATALALRFDNLFSDEYGSCFALIVWHTDKL